MDDIMVPGATFEENIQRLKHTLDRFLSAGLKLKPSKCFFFQTSGKFLDHIVSENGVSTDPKKNRTVQDWDRPRTHKLSSKKKQKNTKQKTKQTQKTPLFLRP
jgi:hypothetical protein